MDEIVIDLGEIGKVSKQMGAELKIISVAGVADSGIIQAGNAAKGREKYEKSDGRPEVLTDKMIYLMEKISEYGYLTINEIKLVYANETYAYKVVSALKDRELAGDFKTTLSPRRAFYLRPNGYRLLEQSNRLRVKRRFNPDHYKSFIFNHRMACARAGLILKTHPLINDFRPESLLWEQRTDPNQKLCDGEFIYRHPGENRAARIGLEVELTLKNREKLDESFEALDRRRDLEQIWWVCGDASIMTSLRNRVSTLHLGQSHLFTTMHDLTAMRHRLFLVDAMAIHLKLIRQARPWWRPL